MLFCEFIEGSLVEHVCLFESQKRFHGYYVGGRLRIYEVKNGNFKKRRSHA